MIDDIALFVHIVRQGGLADAARYANLPGATVTRRLQRLEGRLGVKLLHRSARQCVPTEEGEVYYHAYADLVDQFEQTGQRLGEDLLGPRGPLRVFAPANLSHGFLRHMWLGFIRDYPEIQLELHLSNHLQDMIRERADIALRVGPQADSALTQQRVGRIGTLLVASGEYLARAGEPQEPSELKDHRLVGTTLVANWTLSHATSSSVQEIFPRYAARFNDTAFVKYAVRDGQGVALLPHTEVMDALASGELRQVLPQWRGLARDLYLVWPSGRLLNEKGQCLRRYLGRYLEAHLPQ